MGVFPLVSICRHRAMLYSRESVTRLTRQVRVAGGMLIRYGILTRRALTAAHLERRPQAVDEILRCGKCRIVSGTFTGKAVDRTSAPRTGGLSAFWTFGSRLMIG